MMSGRTYRFLLEGPSGLELLDAARRGEGDLDTDGERGMLARVASLLRGQGVQSSTG